MSEFNRFCSAAKRTAGKITTKAGELADLAALKLKIKGLQLALTSNTKSWESWSTGICTLRMTWKPKSLRSLPQSTGCLTG